MRVRLEDSTSPQPAQNASVNLGAQRSVVLVGKEGESLSKQALTASAIYGDFVVVVKCLGLRRIENGVAQLVAAVA